MNHYRVTTNEDGEMRWWQPHDTIPPGQRNERPATAAEAQLMTAILRQDRRGQMPPVALGRQLVRLLAAFPVADVALDSPPPGNWRDVAADLLAALEDAADELNLRAIQTEERGDHVSFIIAQEIRQHVRDARAAMAKAKKAGL